MTPGKGRPTVAELSREIERLDHELAEIKRGNPARSEEEKLDLRIKVALVLLFGIMVVSLMLFIATGQANA